MAENSANVTTGKPKIGGACSIAPAGTTLPTDATTALANTFTNLGYISDEGLVNSLSVDSETFKAWGGGVVDVMETGREDKFKFTLIEAINADVLKAIYGSGSVTGTLSGTSGMKLTVNSAQREEHVWVFDMVLKGNVAKRVIIPRGKISELGDVSYKDNEVVGYEITITCEQDSTSAAATHYEYIKAPTT